MSRRNDAKNEKADVLTARARRSMRKGEPRKAMLALREAVALDPSAARFTRFGVLLGQLGRTAEAVEALKQALFLFRSAGERGRARTVARLILSLDPAEPSALRSAARLGWT
jgi:Flp pilus assembly protein TadD